MGELLHSGVPDEWCARGVPIGVEELPEAMVCGGEKRGMDGRRRRGGREMITWQMGGEEEGIKRWWTQKKIR